jgi:hypothetical protein
MIATKSEEVFVCGNRKVSLEFFEIVRDQAIDMIPMMKPHVKFTAETLCGDEFWELLGTSGLRRLAGGCIAKLVRDGDLPLVMAGKKGSIYLYRRK